MDSTQQMASWIFTVVTVQIGIALVILGLLYKDIRRILDDVEPCERLAYIIKSKESIKSSTIYWLVAGFVSLVISIGAGTIALIAVAAPMLGFNWGPFQQSNFEWGRYISAFSVFTFVLGFWFVGVAFLIKLAKYIPRKKRDIEKQTGSRDLD